MFNLCDEPGAAREAMTYSDAPGHLPGVWTFASRATRSQASTSAHFRQDTVVVVDTRNSCYRFVMLDGWRPECPG